jgi:hypothetical protein
VATIIKSKGNSILSAIKAGGKASSSAGAFNKYGYDIGFDAKGRSGELSIDFEAIAAHILSIKRAADAKQFNIRRVIFDPKLQPFLHTTRAWRLVGGASKILGASVMGTAR